MAPCKTYLVFGGINRRLENMRPNTLTMSVLKTKKLYKAI
ncbi:hypothetical protein FAM18119_02684 [Lacticaseibacillus paracasei]|nr:hypothetical protein FAM18119_02684 [Lacticaseibacillus paracasei]